MKLCIPVEKSKDGKTNVYGHFGSAPYFLIFDTEANTSKLIENGNMHHSHGTCNPLLALSDEKIDAVVTGGMGGRAVMKLNENGIKVFRYSGQPLEELEKLYRAGSLDEITAANACAHHDCHK